MEAQALALPGPISPSIWNTTKTPPQGPIEAPHAGLPQPTLNAANKGISPSPPNITSVPAGGGGGNNSWVRDNPGALAGIIAGGSLALVAVLLLLYRHRTQELESIPSELGTRKLHGGHADAGLDKPRESFAFAASIPAYLAPPQNASIHGPAAAPVHTGIIDAPVPAPKRTSWVQPVVSWVQNDLFNFNRSRASSAASTNDLPLSPHTAASPAYSTTRVGHLSPGGPTGSAMRQAVARAVLADEAV